MLEQKAQLFTEEQIRGFFYVIGALVLTNISAVLGAVFQYFRRIWKLKTDLNFAHNKIRLLEANQKKFEKELRNITLEIGEKDEFIRRSLEK